MGSALRLTVRGSDPDGAARAWSAVRADVELTEACLSRFRATSDLAHLNVDAGGAWVTAPARLMAMLSIAWRAQRISGGRFDPRVLERLEALGEHAGVPLPPPTVSTAPGAPWLLRDGRTRRVRIAQPVDSGGIGKGLALRWALAAARQAAPEADGLLLDAGGDVVTAGSGPEEGAWNVGVEDPGGGDSPLAVIRARDTAIATSSVAVRHWTGPNGEPVHHLIDPRTGLPARSGLLAVSVAHADPAWAEVWSKSLFIAGASKIGPEARRRDLAAWWVEADGSLHLTPAARARTIWIASEAGTG